jgi:hypothetical protein
MFKTYVMYLYFTKLTSCSGFMGIVCQPSTFTSLELGYVYVPEDGGKVLPVQEIDLRLWAFGEKTGQDPTDYGFRFKAGGEWHDVQVNVSSSGASDIQKPSKLLKVAPNFAFFRLK